MKCVNCLVTFCLLLLIGCTQKEKLPKGVLPMDEMKNVLWDVFLAESLARQKSGSDTTVNLSDQVKENTARALKSHGVTEEQFFKSYNWYVDHPGLFTQLLDSLYQQKSDLAAPDRLVDPPAGNLQKPQRPLRVTTEEQ